MVFVLVPLLMGQQSDSQHSAKDNSCGSGGCPAQTSQEPVATATGPKAGTTQSRHVILKRFGRTQLKIWTSPFRTRPEDLQWILPAGGATAGLIASDQETAPRFRKFGHTDTISRLTDAGLAGYVATAGGMYLIGKWSGRERLKDSGVLVAESLAHSWTVSTVSKFAFGRRRPLEGMGDGRFWGGGSSLPSTHSMMAWSAASTITHRYPGPLTKLVAYGAATSISLGRVMAGRHFATDVFVGGAAGYLIGRQVYREAESYEADIRSLGVFVPETERLSIVASPFVPLDHWSYAAVDRLAANAVIDTAYMGHRPWTRDEFVRLIQEVETDARLESASGFIPSLLNELDKEFTPAKSSKREWDWELETVYGKLDGIAGKPLTDGYHFGQTIANDFGRPYQEGVNAQVGASGMIHFKKLLVHVRGEYQHAPSTQALPLSAANFISSADGTPFVAPVPLASRNRFRLLDAYASFPLGIWQLSFGKQSQWWGQGEAGAMNLSNNAEPILMFKIDQTQPRKLPWILGALGPFRTVFFLGRLDGHRFISNFKGNFGPHLRLQPLMHGQKLSFKPTPNLEFGFSVTTIFGGDGYPLNARAFLRSFGISNTFPGDPTDPGDRRAGFDFRYRIPGLRKWVTLYNDSMTEDEFSPIAYPRRSAMAPGLFLSQLPKIPKADLRLESAYTALPNLRALGSYYFNNRFRSGFTNEGNLLGHPVGRDGHFYYAAARYWFAPRKTVEMNIRKTTINQKFLPGGGSTLAVGFSSSLSLSGGTMFSPAVQYETWKVPSLLTTKQNNLSFSVRFFITPSKFRW